MGTLYREEVKCYNKGIFKGAMSLILGCLFLLLLCFISDVILFGDYFHGFLVLSFSLGIFLTLKCKRKISKVYRYEIIDKEVIIEDVTKGRRNVKLSFNIKNIVDIKSLEEKLDYKIKKEYNFICNRKGKNTKVCVFEKNNKFYILKFEPSESLIKKIEIIREKNIRKSLS